jgi:hypothetical protein
MSDDTLRPLDDESIQRASRTFRHKRCGGLTTLTGRDLLRLECPFIRIYTMRCAACQGQVGLNDMFWENTGEMIWEYRRRIAFSLPFWRRLRVGIFGNEYEAALNLRQDEQGRIVQPLDPPPVIS